MTRARSCASKGSRSDDEIFVVELRTRQPGRSVGQLRRAAVALIAVIAEESTHILQRRDGDMLEFDIATGTAPSEARFAPHGHLVRLRIRPGGDAVRSAGPALP